MVCLGARANLQAAVPADLSTLPVWDQPQMLNGFWKFRSGDSAAWARPDYAASHWDSLRLIDAQFRPAMDRSGVAWYRKEIHLPPKPPGAVLALFKLPFTPQEFYWDGQLIGRTGRVGAVRAEERIGDRMLAEIPGHLAGAGRHVLAIRLSAHNPALFPTPAQVWLGEPEALELGFTREMMGMFFLAGVFFFGAIYRFLNYRASGYGRNTVFFSLFVLSCAVYIVSQYVFAVLDYGEGTFLAARIAMSLAWYFMICMVPDYFVFAETFPYRWVLPALLIGGLFVAAPMGLVWTGYIPYHWSGPIYAANQGLTYLSIGVSIWVIAWAAWRRQTGSGAALLGILSLLIGVNLTWIHEIDWAWAAGVAAHVLFLARAQSQQMAERMQSYREVDLRSARLEIELLKKNIQPHFLLNSLNSIIAWLEEEPKTAARLVNALADELGMLLRISSRKTISLEEEIALCRTHLQVMGLRQDKTYSLDCSGLRGDEQVPPMVLHTLVENGLTHGYAGRVKGSFTLTRRDVPGGVRYSLFNDGSPREKKEKKGEGTGLRYVRTRLEEAFPGRWSLESGPAGNGWEVTLDIKRENS